jgi:Flp pilus assembly protein TadD
LLEPKLRRLIELEPDSPLAYNALGYIFADRNMHLAEARELIEKAHSLSPNCPFILDSMGWVLYRQGDLPGALAYLKRAYVLRQDPEIAAHIGEVLWHLGRKEEAKKMLREAQLKFPTSDVLLKTIREFIH